MGNKAIHSQQMMGSCQCQPKVLAITGGKGGAGKANITTNPAICLAASQKIADNLIAGGLGGEIEQWFSLTMRDFLRKLPTGSPKVIGRKVDNKL